jgi:preprotein translocase subunit SecB
VAGHRGLGVAEQQVEQEAIFTFEKIYIKDVSFESPSAPKIFGKEKTQEVTVQCDIEHKPIDDAKRFFEVVITVKVGARQEDMTSFIVEVQQGGVFQIVGVAEEDMPGILEVSCPNVLMPFAREVICNLIVKGGFPQLLIDPINFQARYEHNLAAQKKKV